MSYGFHIFRFNQLWTENIWKEKNVPVLNIHKLFPSAEIKHSYQWAIPPIYTKQYNYLTNIQIY
jgi:hypothetical protein